MFYVLAAAAAVLIFAVVAIAWRLRVRAQARKAEADVPDVIYLGYDNRDGVSSMRSTLLDRLDRGDLDLS